MSIPLVIMASSREISSFISLDGKCGIRGESFTAPSANKLIKVFEPFLHRTFGDNKDTQTPTVSLSRI